MLKTNNKTTHNKVHAYPEFPSSGTFKAEYLKAQGCIQTKTLRGYKQKGPKNSRIFLMQTLPGGVEIRFQLRTVFILFGGRVVDWVFCEREVHIANCTVLVLKPGVYDEYIYYILYR